MNSDKEQTIQYLKSLLSNLSSDLRTPLSIISGYADVLLQQERGEIVLQDSFTRREALENIVHSGKYVADVWKDYFDLALAIFKQETSTKQQNEIPIPELIVNLRQLTANLRAEIRSPLGAVMGYAELLLMFDSYDGIDGFTRREMLRAIRPASEKVFTLLELVYQTVWQTVDDNFTIE